MNPAGRYWLDSKDLWTIFSIIVESGSDDFLKFPSRKESITRDWSDQNGIDVDLSAHYFNARDIKLDCAIIADSEADFWAKYSAFINQWMLPGEHRLQVAEFAYRSFTLFYKECGAFQRFTRVKIEENGDIKVACKFSITLTEKEPSTPSTDIFIVDEEGRFLIT